MVPTISPEPKPSLVPPTRLYATDEAGATLTFDLPVDGVKPTICDVYLYPEVHPLAIRLRDIAASDWFYSSPSITEIAAKYGMDARAAARLVSRYSVPICETTDVRYEDGKMIVHIEAPCLRPGTTDIADVTIVYRTNKK